MPNILKNFAKSEDGAITVDWVVLTAAMVSLGLMVVASVSSGAKTNTDNIASAQNAVKVSSAW